jgi:6-phosphogluconolactonase
MTEQTVRWQVFAQVDELIAEAETRIALAAAEAIEDRGRFHIVLAGGTTPQSLYHRLAAAGAGGAAWNVWFGDERCLPLGDPDRNETMARQAWLDGSGIPSAHIHGIPAGPDPGEAARSYAAELEDVGQFDLVLLGIGEDGHTASLFPGLPVGDESDSEAAMPVFDAPKPPPERVSLTARRLSDARQVIVLATGGGKAEAIRRWRAGTDLPISRIRPDGGVDVFLDEGAMASVSVSGQG